MGQEPAGTRACLRCRHKHRRAICVACIWDASTARFSGLVAADFDDAIVDDVELGARRTLRNFASIRKLFHLFQAIQVPVRQFRHEVTTLRPERKEACAALG